MMKNTKTGALKESRRWRVAYDDGMAIVFRPAALAGSRMQQVFTGITGGIGGGDPEITSVKTKDPEGSVFRRSLNP